MLVESSHEGCRTKYLPQEVRHLGWNSNPKEHIEAKRIQLDSADAGEVIYVPGTTEKVEMKG